MTPEDDLDREIQLADETREKISLCIIQIQAALKGVYRDTAELADGSQRPARQERSGSREGTPEHSVCHVKLPKLSIKKFGGDLTK